MFSFDVKIVKFENPTEVWFQVLIIKFIFGVPYFRTYHTTGYGEHTRDIKYDTYDEAKKDKIRLYNMLKTKYNTKTIKTVMD